MSKVSHLIQSVLLFQSKWGHLCLHFQYPLLPLRHSDSFGNTIIQNVMALNSLSHQCQHQGKQDNVLMNNLVDGYVSLHLFCRRRNKKTGTQNTVVAAITSTCVAHTPGFQFCWHKSSIVLMFNDGIKYGKKVILFSVTFLTVMSSSCIPSN